MRPLWIAISDLSKQDSVQERTFVRSLWHVCYEEVRSPPNSSSSEPLQPR